VVDFRVEMRQSQGSLLATKETMKWTPEHKMEVHEQERKMVFRYFSSLDEGRSRELVCVCQSPVDAKLIVDLHNAALKALTEAQK
jgi:hypothetical protein